MLTDRTCKENIARSSFVLPVSFTFSTKCILQSYILLIINLLLSILFTLFSDPPEFVTKPKALYQQAKGKDITIPCSAQGDPTPQVEWRKVGTNHRFRKEITQLLYCPVQWRRQPWRSNWGYLGFCWPHTRKHMQTKCAHDLCTLCGVSHMFIFMLRPQYICTWQITVKKNPKYPQLEPHTGIRMVQVLGAPFCIRGSNSL